MLFQIIFQSTPPTPNRPKISPSPRNHLPFSLVPPILLSVNNCTTILVLVSVALARFGIIMPNYHPHAWLPSPCPPLVCFPHWSSKPASSFSCIAILVVSSPCSHPYTPSLQLHPCIDVPKSASYPRATVPTPSSYPWAAIPAPLSRPHALIIVCQSWGLPYLTSGEY